ncbi:MAG: alpha-L-fucosidase [Isosphaeraceae bacterium]
MNRRGFLSSTATGLLAAAIAPGNRRGEDEAAGLPRPLPQQIAWQDCELGMFFHFDIPIYKPGWDWRSWKGLPDATLYNPRRLDTDQWLQTASSLGAKYAVLVAKHCSGFLQWQSNLYPYGVKQSPWRGGKGDLVRDFVRSCARYKIKPGIYASVTANGYMEVDNPGLVNRGRGGDPAKQAAYARICEGMLAELWGRYGELFHIWFDGGALPPDQGGPDMLPLLRKYQPHANVFQGPAATVRWVGNENGVTSYPCWATVLSRDAAGSGTPDGKIWLPGECDVPLPGHEWFWTPSQRKDIEPLPRLMDMYYQSVGRNCNLLLNATPGPDGLIPEENLRHYAEFGREIHGRFEKPLAETSGAGEVVELRLSRLQRVDHVIVMEDIAQGERVREYIVEGKDKSGAWIRLCDGIAIGHKRIQRFAPRDASAVRLRVKKSVARPLVRRLAAYCVGR